MKTAQAIEDRVALITGGSKGIGYAIATALAKHHITVVLVARNHDDLAKAKHELSQHAAVHTIQVDLSRPEAYAKIRDYVQQHFGKLDILVNNAGDFKTLPADKRTSAEHIAEDVTNLFAINAIAPAILGHVLQPLQLAAPQPKQLDVLSSAALEIFPGNNPYGQTKVAHERLSLSTVADSNARIRTYRIYPSNTDTRLVKHFDTHKLTPELVGESAVAMLLEHQGTDLYMKMTKHGLVKAMFDIDYCKHVHETSTGDVVVDGLALVQDHHAMIRAHFEPVIKEAK